MHDTRADILVVDDAPENLDLLSAMLAECGYTTRPAISGRLALRAAKARKPDLILLDLHMPEMDGYEVCALLKADEALKEVPVIFISALTETVDKMKAFELGGVDYVTKPFQLKEVAARVRTHLDLVDQRRKLEESYRVLKATERQRDNLVHMLIHDLGSALGPVIAYLDVLDAQVQPADGEVVKRCRRAAWRMTTMITAILDVHRLDGGEMPLQLTECDLARIAQESLERAGADGRASIVVIEPPARPALARADPEITRRILTNLVGNAMKFTPSEREIRVAFDTDDNRVRVRVIDQGRGIPPEAFARIFEKFGQVQGAQVLTRNSFGLGLAFCKLAVQAQGGSIGVDSELDKGSTFWFTLPVSEGA